MKKTIPVIDLFAGPGGLGEGFSAFNNGQNFKILVSAEMEDSAFNTLKLRAFYRELKHKSKQDLSHYYKFCEGIEKLPFNERTKRLWDKACKEAQQLTLGEKSDNKKLYALLTKNKINEKKSWVLIGGPPCQAYSLIGRSRNKSKKDYLPEKDNRHFLYKEYLKVIEKYKPKIFVMENVKGILSSKINGEKIFHTILRDLANPSTKKNSDLKYKIYSLTDNTFYESGVDFEKINLQNFIVKAEDFGIPQARHRVILMGIRSDIKKTPSHLKKINIKFNVEDAIGDLPALRSKLTKQKDGNVEWLDAYKTNLSSLIEEASKDKEYRDLVERLNDYRNIKYINDQLNINKNKSCNLKLKAWFQDKQLKTVLNHETRGHILGDLRRYLYATCFALAYGRSPSSQKDFRLKGLKPNHKNWESGNFSDRFRVQENKRPATTITSHISKDGHYYIHPDPSQCRSLTVREAARLQTFPDNYFFQGTRTQQFRQVGNAVPPLLAFQIAKIVSEII
jgi:DNA (cytosine-5)-methyltransferase 1